MSRKTIFTILLFTVIHFGLLVLAIVNAFTIFRGPSTASEVFWDHVMRVLLFPSILLLPAVHNNLGQSALMVLNSFLWGTAFGLAFIRLRKSR